MSNHTWIRVRQCDCQGQANILISEVAKQALDEKSGVYKDPCPKCGSEIKTIVKAPVDDLQRIKLPNGGRLLSVDFTLEKADA